MVRLLSPEDVAEWRSVRLETLQQHPEAFGDSYEELLLKPDDFWFRQLQHLFVFTYLDGDETVGAVAYDYRPQAKRRHRAEVISAYVRGSHRGRGIMDWLLPALEYHAREQGVEQLHLSVAVDNEAAIRCYARNGYEPYGREPGLLKVEGAYIDVHRMMKYI